MSFAFKLSDLSLVTNLAYNTVQNARKACGAHSALAREVKSLHVVLTKLEAEVARPESLLNSGSGAGSSTEKSKELADLMRDCEGVLRVLKEILEKACLLLCGDVKLTCDVKVQRIVG